MGYSSPVRKIVAASLLILLVAATVLWWFSPLRTGKAQASVPSSNAKTNSAKSSLPYSAVAQGPYTVQGNTILDSSGQPYIFHGIGRDGLEYNCSGEGPLDQQHLAYMGTGTNTSTETYWGANTVRLPLSEGYWLNGAPGFPCTATQYQTLIKKTVDTLTSLKLNVIVDLQWTDAGRQSLQGGGPWAMPDADSVIFWQQVATIYKGYSNVLFEVYNEPHPGPWSCWAVACQMTNDSGYSDDCRCVKTLSYASVGMQAVVDAVRNTGATNLILVGGINWGYDLSQIAQNPISGSNIVYDTHPYPYTDKLPNTWDAAFGNISATYAVISSESGEYDCKSGYMGPLLAYLDAHHISWVSWAWAVVGNLCGYPQLTQDYQGTPSVSMGQLIYQQLRSYSSRPTGPVNKTWYFAEGHVGGGFKEFLTLDNPDPTNDCAASIQYILDNGSSTFKTVAVVHASRLTESANADLNVLPNQPGVSVAAIVTASNSTPACNGIVAERPIYFNYNGINGGSDVLGATQLGSTFYFGDVPTGGGYTSFLSILNPGTTLANVTVTYYANGNTVGSSQTLTVSATGRATLTPESGLPQHVAAIVTSDQPIVAERPDYFKSINAGSPGIVSGGTDIMGAFALANDWLFAEGFTGNSNQKYQENLVIANLDTTANAAATVTINLEYQNGTSNPFTVVVPAQSQTIWNVNTQGLNAGSPEVSADVTSVGAKIIVERQLFFNYNHNVNGTNTNVIGCTDVVGQMGPAAHSSYSFAEGYTNKGYNEWLTLQNPSSSDETIYVSLVNGYNRTYSPAGYLVPAHSRFTIDITALVVQNMVQPGDDHRGYEVSMTVQTLAPGAFFVAERPMYWNASGAGLTSPTQGGSDIFGYVGG